MKELELYLHIPFCVKKCNYCDFLSAPAEEETRAAYVDALLEEIRGFEDPEDYEVVTVFFGGGTPSILPGQEIFRIMEALREKFSFCKGAEITLEANPGTVDKEKLVCYKKAGINRLSFGLQSADAEELKKLVFLLCSAEGVAGCEENAAALARRKKENARYARKDLKEKNTSRSLPAGRQNSTLKNCLRDFL